MNNKYTNALYLLLMLGLLVFSIVFVGIGVNDYFEADEVASLIEPSGIYKDYGYSSIDEWKKSFVDKSLRNILLGIGLMVVVIGMFAYKRFRNGLYRPKGSV